MVLLKLEHLCEKDCVKFIFAARVGASLTPIDQVKHLSLETTAERWSRDKNGNGMGQRPPPARFSDLLDPRPHCQICGLACP